MTPRSTAQFIPWWSLIHLYIYLGLCFEFLEDSVKNFKTPNISTFDLCHVAGLQAERLLMCALKLVETLIDHLWVHTSQSVNQTQAVSTTTADLRTWFPKQFYELSQLLLLLNSSAAQSVTEVVLFSYYKKKSRNFRHEKFLLFLPVLTVYW